MPPLISNLAQSHWLFPSPAALQPAEPDVFMAQERKVAVGVKEGRHSVIAGLATSLTARMGLRHCVIICHCDERL